MLPLTPKTETEQEVRQLIKRLARLKRAWPSEPTLHNLSPLMVDTLLKQIAAVDKFHAYFRVVALSAWVFALCSAATVYNHLFLLFMLPFGVCCVLLRCFREMEKIYATSALTQTDDMRILSPLIEATREKYGRSPQVVSAIKRLLAQVTEEHVGLLNNSVQATLWHFAITPLSHKDRHDGELALLALQAYACSGNRHMLTSMQELSDQPPVYPAQRHVNDTLKHLVPIMEARLKRQEAPQTLLRAADMPIAQPDTLLRAAYSATPEPASQLLRASIAEDREL